MFSPRKALIVTPFYKPNIGGAETFAEDLSKSLSEKFLVHICTIKWREKIVFEKMDYKQAFLLLRKLALPLLRINWRYRYEKVYALGLMSSFLCILFGIRFSAVILALYDFKRKNIFTILLNRAEKVFVEGEKGREEMLKIGINPDKIVAFTHWCDQSVFEWSERNNKRMKVLFVGRPLSMKGKHIVQECEKLTTGIDYEYVENCEFKDLPEHYQMADVVVVPSLYSEGFSRVVIEASSCGCAIIVSNRGSLPEQVKGFGKVVEPTASDFSYVLKKLNGNRDALHRLQLETFVYAKKHFSDANADCFLL